jgi:hypothetical protein
VFFAAERCSPFIPIPSSTSQPRTKDDDEKEHEEEYDDEDEALNKYAPKGLPARHSGQGMRQLGQMAAGSVDPVIYYVES